MNQEKVALQEENNQNIDQNDSMEEVISQRRICYYSNFDINVNDWFVEYENIQIFQQNVQKNLGNLWLQYLSEAIKPINPLTNEVDQQSSSHTNANQLLSVLLECFLLEVPQVPSDIDTQIQLNKTVTYQQEITSSFSGTQKQDSLLTNSIAQRFNMNLQFEEFYKISIQYFQGSNISPDVAYQIVDQQTFKSLLHTFYYVAMKEMSNITKKRESDERFAIGQLTEKALAKHNQSKLASKGSWSSGLTSASIDSQSTKISHTSRFNQQMQIQRYEETKETGGIMSSYAKTTLKKKDSLIDNQVWKQNMSSLIPGFSIIKNKVITPLLVATEKVVDYIISDDHKQENMDAQNNNSDNQSVSENKSLPDAFNSLSIQDSERRRKLKRRRYQHLYRESNLNNEMAETVDENLLSKATDCIEIISKRRKITESVTSQFVTNIIDINNNALNTLKEEHQGEQMEDIDQEQQTENQWNLRFIKPSKNFYNNLMALWLRFDKSRLNQITFEEFLNHLKKHTSNKPQTQQSKNNVDLTVQQLKPTQQFFVTLKNEWIRMRQSSQEFSISQFFNQVKSKLFQKWNDQIINKSKEFQQASSQ